MKKLSLMIAMIGMFLFIGIQNVNAVTYDTVGDYYKIVRNSGGGDVVVKILNGTTPVNSIYINESSRIFYLGCQYSSGKPAVTISFEFTNENSVSSYDLYLCKDNDIYTNNDGDSDTLSNSDDSSCNNPVFIHNFTNTGAAGQDGNGVEYINYTGFHVGGESPITKGTEVNGTFSLSATQAAPGESVIVTTTPALGYVVKKITLKDAAPVPGNSKWTASDIDVTPETDNTTTFSMPQYATIVVVEFYQPPVSEYTITKGSETNGTFNVDKVSASSGATITISDITPSSGHQFKEVKILKASDNSDITTAVSYNATNKTFIMPDYAVKVGVEFEKIPYTITVNNVDGATITPNGTINVLYGDNKDITITANTGYRLKSVKVDDVEKLPLTDNKVSLTNITKNMSIVVTVEKIPYTITVNNVEGATITPNGTINVLYGDNKDITITANTGYRLKSVKVDDVEKLPLTDNKVSLTNITKNMSIVVTVEKIVYNFDDDSKNVTYTVGTDKTLSLRVEDTDLSNLDKVYVNDKLLDSKYYDTESGSIIVKLKETYLNTLANGTYNLKVTTLDGGEANTTFVIANSSIVNPKTGDGIMTSVLLGGISILGLLGTTMYLKKKKVLN